jgi:hypothetical protein
MNQTPDNRGAPPSPASRRGQDDRRTEVNPADNPAPSSPDADTEAVRKGEASLDSVTTK